MRRTGAAKTGQRTPHKRNKTEIEPAAIKKPESAPSSQDIISVAERLKIGGVQDVVNMIK